ncbi:hypothetical protein ColTof4_13956 [Colletotrichum tofieldiae]|uniref:AA1-like domain-containing protein n=2 Tax=Colletotrichum spaethianum species complex TaxID=2707349 RepID=A0A161YDE1_9PEZI|nr:hypothetical protein CT0861_09555 [Colletotrichum tofieldiae]GJC77163.1 effector protein PevD1 [Colletotrichum liriopes]GKT56173.1 hypothetical protein ColTof3_03512 [Colletotrichum tofieldiae]GKT81533.1 hypothetical protein ColTof4_13956 [Colletotrichum tofieldiae]
MHFALATIVTLSASVLAAPAPQASAIDPETIVVLDFSVRHQTDASVDSVGLHITGHDAENLYCGKTGEVVLGEKYACGDSKYSFSLQKDSIYTWGIHVFHQWGVASGVSGYRGIDTICHAGPLGSTICTAPGPVWFYIGSV